MRYACFIAILGWYFLVGSSGRYTEIGPFVTEDACKKASVAAATMSWPSPCYFR